mmetsp:Transcript_19940/g.48341  ORF Transcript_19940/g.48341 Transcript_19940/m.48341 type:complete len:95 (-) Transcript_19940:4043-4327(-)
MSNKLKFIREKFKNFLINFSDESARFIYREKLKNLVISNRKTLNIFLEDIEMFDKRLFKSIHYRFLLLRNKHSPRAQSKIKYFFCNQKNPYPIV